MKTISLLIALFAIGCAPSPSPPTTNKVVEKEDKSKYKRIKNEHWSSCKHKTAIKTFLQAKLEMELSSKKMPENSYSQWFMDQHNPEYCNPKVTKELDEIFENNIKMLIKTTNYNYSALEDTTQIFNTLN